MSKAQENVKVGILYPGDQVPLVLLPDRETLFPRRADRYRSLAAAHDGPADLLLFLATLAAAQHLALGQIPDIAPSPAEQIRLCAQHGLPPLGAQAIRPGPEWRMALRQIAKAFASLPLPPASRVALTRLADMDDAVLDTWALALLRGVQQPVDPALVPFLAAALQVYWVRMAAALEEDGLQPLEAPGLCPVCGSPPIAGTLRLESHLYRSRYLHCSLCATAWHLVRIQCSHCDATDGIRYQSIDGHFPAVSAETCEKCKTYIKIMNMEKDPELDPVADDVTSIALDILLGEAGWRRTAINPALLTPEE